MDTKEQLRATNSHGKRALIITKLVVRIFGLLTGIGSVILGGVTMKRTFDLWDRTQDRFLVALVSLFLIIFGVFLILAETRNRHTTRLMKYFLFLNTYIGRGIFYIIAGVLCLALPITIDGTSWGKVVGWCMVGAGSLNLILFPFACIYREDKDATKPHRLDEGDDNFSSSSSSSVKPTHMELPSPADNSVGRSPKSTYNPPKPINPFDDV